MKERLRQRRNIIAISAVIVLFLIWPYIVPTKYWVSLLEQFFVFGLFAVSLGFLMGYMGVNSLGHTVFFGLGSYITAILSVRFGFHTLLAALFGLFGVILLGVIIGICTSRMRGIIFMMVTVAFSQIFWGVANKWLLMTGGENGIVGVPKPVIAGISITDTSLYYMLMILFFVCVFIIMQIARTPFGLAVKGIKGTESRMRVLGYNVRFMKALVIVLTGFFAGVAGIMWVWFNGYAGTGDFAVRNSAKSIIMVLVGGVGTIIGPIIGSFTIVFAESYISSFSERWPMIMGILYIVVVLTMKGGIVGIVRRAFTEKKATLSAQTAGETQEYDQLKTTDIDERIDENE